MVSLAKPSLGDHRSAFRALALALLLLAQIALAAAAENDAPAIRTDSVKNMQKKLRTRTDIDADNVPFEEFIKNLAKQHDLTIQLNDAALQRAGVDRKEPVTAHFKDVTVNVALLRILGDLKLEHVFEDGMIVIKDAAGQPNARVAIANNRLIIQAFDAPAEAVAQKVGPQDVGDLIPDPAPAAPQEAQFGVADENFEQWIFGNSWNNGKPRDLLDRNLQLALDDVARVHEFSEAQRLKLETAGRGDIKRFLERVEALRAKFQEAKKDQNKLQKFFGEIQPLQMTLQSGLFGDGSLYAKTIPRTLSSDQMAEYAKAVDERKAFSHQAMIDSAVAALDESLALRDEQRRQLVKLMLEKTKPPRKTGPYDLYVLMIHFSHIPAENLKPILDDRQQRALTRVMPRYQQMEPFLKQSGYLGE